MKKIFLFSVLALTLTNIFNYQGIASESGLSSELRFSNAEKSGIFYSLNNFDSDQRDFIFESPRPLKEDNFTNPVQNNSWGVDLALSTNGFGFGTHFTFPLFENASLYTQLLFSGARNTDEFEEYDYTKNEYVVRNKINRLYMFPLSIGINYNILTETLGNSFKPFLSAGVTPTAIISTPYDREFFNAFHHGMNYWRIGWYAGVGSDFIIARSLLKINLKYLSIPFGGDGLESVQNSPIKDFGGVFITISIGGKF